MIEQLGIENFQSHEESVFDLGPGVNTIVGTSNNGKSAVLRGLRWLLFNKPNGIGFVSHWNLTEKGALKNTTKAWVKLSGGINITRYRTKDENGYKIGEKNLEAIGQDLPEEVAKLLNITDVNFQNQLDAHFLLSESAGEVARFFNRTIRLDIIDTLLAAVESKKRKNKAEVESLAETVKDYVEELAGLGWIEMADTYLAKAEALDEKITSARRSRDTLAGTVEEYDDFLLVSRAIDTTDAEKAIETIETAIVYGRGYAKAKAELEESLGTFEDYQTTLYDLSKLPAVIDAVTKLELVTKVIEDAKEQIKDLETDLTVYEKAKASVTAAEALPDIDDYLTKIEEKQTAIALDRGAFKILCDTLEAVAELQSVIDDADAAIEAAEASLPDLCPLCGNPWDGGTDE